MTTVSDQSFGLSPYVYPSLDAPRWWPMVDERAQAGLRQEGACEIIGRINNSSVTPEDFDRLMEQYPGYQPHFGAIGGFTALAIAVRTKNIPLVLHLINRFPYLVNSSDQNTTPILVTVVDNSDLSLLKIFIAKGANIALGAKDGTTALYAASAIFRGPDPERFEKIKYLLRCKAVVYFTKYGSILFEKQKAEIDAAIERVRIENAAIELVRSGEVGVPLLDNLPGELRDKICKLVDHTT